MFLMSLASFTGISMPRLLSEALVKTSMVGPDINDEFLFFGYTKQ
jgi:hypothetical protein